MVIKSRLQSVIWILDWKKNKKKFKGRSVRRTAQQEESSKSKKWSCRVPTSPPLTRFYFLRCRSKAQVQRRELRTVLAARENLALRRGGGSVQLGGDLEGG